LTSRKREILYTAAQLFKDKGYATVTMRDIAAGLDMKAASLYNHISGKQELLGLLVLAVAKSFTHGMQRVLNTEPHHAKRLQLLIDLHIDIAIKYTHELAIMNTDWMHLEGENYSTYTQLRKAYENDFKTVLRQGMEEEVFVKTDIDTALYNLLSTLRNLYLWIPKRTEKEVEQLRKELPLLLLNGIQN
jgi:Transcriptional regulator